MADVYWHSDDFSDLERQEVQQLTQSYAQVVIDEEWPLMEQGQASLHAAAIAHEMRSTIYDFEPSNAAEQVLYEQGLERVHELVDERRLRLLEAREGMPDILWGVLLVGGIIVVGFTYLFGLENTRSHTLMIAALAAIIALVLFTIYALNHPFTGITRIKPDAFELVLDTFEEYSER